MKPICVPCQRFYRAKKNGFEFIEAMPVGNDRPEPGSREPDKWTPYKLWQGDLWECEGCGHQLVSGVAQRPIAEHYEPDFTERIERLRHSAAHYAGRDELFQVNDC